MAKVNFTLSARVDRLTGKSKIKIRFIASRLVSLRADSGLFLPPEKWNEKTCKVRVSTIKSPEQIELLSVQNQLTELSTMILTRFASTAIGRVNKKWLEQIIYEYHHPSTTNVQTATSKIKTTNPNDDTQAPSLNSYFEAFVESCSKRRNKKTGRLIAKSTARSYKTTFNHITKFTNLGEKDFYSFDEIDEDFYNDFINYLESNEFTANTVGKIIKTLKAVLRQAEREKVNTNMAFHDFIAFSESVDNVYLSEAELEKIRTTDLKKSPQEVKKLIANQNVDFKMIEDDWLVYGSTLEKIRDWFFLLAWTASRFSDLEKITQQEVNSGFITFRQQKTNEKVVIPVHPVIREIFVRNKHKMPSPISIQKFNNYIKIICLLAGIDNIESRTRTEGGVLRTKRFPKWILISSHTGRRSFCTNMYLRGFPILTIMAISGHTTEKSFLEYIKVTKQQHAQFMMNLWKKFYQPVEPGLALGALPSSANFPTDLMPFPNHMNNIFSDIQGAI